MLVIIVIIRSSLAVPMLVVVSVDVRVVGWCSLRGR